LRSILDISLNFKLPQSNSLASKNALSYVLLKISTLILCFFKTNKTALLAPPAPRTRAFFIDLISKNLLQDSYFTFSNNYGCNLLESIDINELKSNIPDRLNQSRSNIETWIEGIPYSTSGKLLDPNPNDINNMIEHSKLNIVYETNPIKSTSMISEKTYKAMFFKKPFIIVCHRHTLKLLKDCGYMTFSPWINESYDEIEDYEERVVAILNEIERLNSLSDTELDLIIEQCNHVIEHNYNWMISEYKNSLIWPDEFILSNI